MLKDRLSHNNFIGGLSGAWVGIIIACLVLLHVLLHPGDGCAAEDKTPKTHEEFTALKNESFSVYGGKGLRRAVYLKLIDVSPLHEQAQTVDFALRFQGPADYPLDKNVYTFELGKTGAFPLFLEPAGGDAQARYYQALFNLVK